MLRHVVMFRFAPDAPADAAEKAATGLSALPGLIEEIETYRFGRDLGLRAGNFDFCLVAEFADAEAFARYVDHPAHRRFIRECIEPAVSERVAVQYEV
ncbi:MAG: Dabb family protein [Deltaproteobacteria bacterium]|nr:Dabb family protein [Deltaproteobacteria bacterium]MBW2498921.1 Dabb family protein [Deltaproteobacteria bacterium]